MKSLKNDLHVIEMMLNEKVLNHINFQDLTEDENLIKKLNYIAYVLKIPPIKLFQEKQINEEKPKIMEKKKKERALSSIKSTDFTIFENVLLESSMRQRTETGVIVNPFKILSNLIDFRKKTKFAKPSDKSTNKMMMSNSVKKQISKKEMIYAKIADLNKKLKEEMFFRHINHKRTNTLNFGMNSKEKEELVMQEKAEENKINIDTKFDDISEFEFKVNAIPSAVNTNLQTSAGDNFANKNTEINKIDRIFTTHMLINDEKENTISAIENEDVKLNISKLPPKKDNLKFKFQRSKAINFKDKPKPKPNKILSLQTSSKNTNISKDRKKQINTKKVESNNFVELKLLNTDIAIDYGLTEVQTCSTLNKTEKNGNRNNEIIKNISIKDNRRKGQRFEIENFEQKNKEHEIALKKVGELKKINDEVAKIKPYNYFQMKHNSELYEPYIRKKDNLALDRRVTDNPRASLLKITNDNLKNSRKVEVEKLQSGIAKQLLTKCQKGFLEGRKSYLSNKEHLNTETINREISKAFFKNKTRSRIRY